MQEMLSAIVFLLIVPGAGVAYFLHIYTKMKVRKVNRAPVLDLFLIFATYGGLVLLILTSIFGRWSGLASLGTLYLVFGAPIVMACIAYRQKDILSISLFHRNPPAKYRSGMSA